MARKLLKIGKLKNKAWRLLSEYVRRKNADLDGNVTCVTCGARKHYTSMHASHFIHGHSKETFLAESNVHPACVKCNLYLSGNLIEYYEFMVKTYGQEAVDALRRVSHNVFKPSRDYLDGVIAKYQALLDGMGK